MFGWSVAETLRKALALLGRAERVVALPDLLSVGPIDPPDRASREAWATSALGLDAMPGDELDDEPIDAPAAWADATAIDVAPVFWACLTSAPEHACFLAYAERMQDRSFDVIDATDLDVTTQDGVDRPSTLALYRATDLVASGLYERRRPIPPEARRAAAAAWSALRRENAPFRIVRDGRLVSVPLTHYDALLVEHASQDWEIAARTIGRAITALGTEARLRGQANGSEVLFGRLLALGAAGILEVAGPGPGLRDYQVRTPRPGTARTGAR